MRVVVGTAGADRARYIPFHVTTLGWTILSHDNSLLNIWRSLITEADTTILLKKKGRITL
jgi:hypothetical protein